jgi:hypothetical protein
MLQQPDPSTTTIPVRDTLFGDLPLSHWAKPGTNELPWSAFKAVTKSIEAGNEAAAIILLKEIIALPDLESRHYLQAFHFLNQLGIAPEGEIKIFAVVVEVAMEDGVDLLAVYADHSARYYNFSGAAIIWDAADDGITSKIDHILELSKDIVDKIGPWEGERPAVPKDGFARVNFLTSHGLHFGEADQTVLFRDPMAGKLMYAMLNMMETLTEKVNKNNQTKK